MNAVFQVSFVLALEAITAFWAGAKKTQMSSNPT
jgi:hypothetical protein